MEFIGSVFFHSGATPNLAHDTSRKIATGIATEQPRRGRGYLALGAILIVREFVCCTKKSR